MRRAYHWLALHWYWTVWGITRRIGRQLRSRARWERLFDWELDHLVGPAYYHEEWLRCGGKWQ